MFFAVALLRTTQGLRGLLRAAFAATLVQAVALSGAHANLRAPLVEAQAPSSAAGPVDGAASEVAAAQVLGEVLTFRCQAAACDVEARYHIRVPAAVAMELAFILPSATPIAVTVGGATAPVHVTPAPPEEMRSDGAVFFELHSLASRRVPLLQARFSAPFVAGENTVVVTYRQPLGREEHGHSYFSKGRFTQFFRYELWPLSEWKHATGFRVDGDVTIHRPSPSWWKRTFSRPLSVGCRGPTDIEHAHLDQRGDELHFAFQVTDPLPPRLWCSIGDDDLVPEPHVPTP